MSKHEPYGLTTPCHDCPFRNDIRPFIRSERVWEIQEGLVRGEFPCHKTTEHRDDEEGEPEYVPTDGEIHCAGALILMEKLGESSQMMRISERLGLYDRTKLNMAAPVYDSWEEMYEAHVEEEERQDAKRRAKQPKKRKRKP